MVTDTLRAFDKGTRVVYPGKLLVRLSTWGARFMPRNVIFCVASGTVQNLNQRDRSGSEVSQSTHNQPMR